MAYLFCKWKSSLSGFSSCSGGPSLAEIKEDGSEKSFHWILSPPPQLSKKYKVSRVRFCDEFSSKRRGFSQQIEWPINGRFGVGIEPVVEGFGGPVGQSWRKYSCVISTFYVCFPCQTEALFLRGKRGKLISWISVKSLTPNQFN